MPPTVAPVPPLALTVVGQPVPQGSKNVGQHGGVYESGGKRLRSWRSEVTGAALEAVTARGGGPLWGRGEAVVVSATFWLPAPQRAVQLLERGLPSAPAEAPDSDKLARGLGDSLSDAQVWADDGQADWGRIERRWAWRHPPGVDVDVRGLDWGRQMFLTKAAPTGLCHLVSVAAPSQVTVCGTPRDGLGLPSAAGRPCGRCVKVAARYGWAVAGVLGSMFTARADEVPATIDA